VNKPVENTYLKLLHRLEDMLQDEEIDNIIPALTTLLSQAGWLSTRDKKVFVAYVVNAIDRTYEVMEKKRKNQ
jgi:NADH:ubiquinone oxidoreductase subunit E